jgi:hypothetical protein
MRKNKDELMDKLKELVSKCKCSVEITINDHRDVYDTVDEYITDEDKEDIDNEVFQEMVKRNTIVRIQFYPRTPINFCVIYHYDIDEAINIALNTFNS